MEIIKQRPLCQYYLWQVYRLINPDQQKSYAPYLSNQMIGSFRAARKNLEKINDERLSEHIASLALLEEVLTTMSEIEFEKLLQELQKKFLFEQNTAPQK